MNFRNAAFIVAYCIGSTYCLPARGQKLQAPTPKMLATMLTSTGYDIHLKAITARQTSATTPKNTLVGRKNEPQATALRYTVDYSASSLIAITGKSGLLSFAGHNHAVIATKWSAVVGMTLVDMAHSSVTISVETARLVIDNSNARQKAGLGPGPGLGEIPTIQKRMLSEEVLDASRYPNIRFTSTAMKAEGAGHLRVSGDLELHGHHHHVVIPLRYQLDRTRIIFDGDFVIRQTDYGLRPEIVAGGTVKVKDQVVVRVHIELARVGLPIVPQI